MTKPKSEEHILEAVHDAASDLRAAGVLDLNIMRRFDVLCQQPVKPCRAEDVLRIRQQANVTQAVFAAVLNVGRATVCAWEDGTKSPSGAALKLLELVERKGLEALA